MVVLRTWEAFAAAERVIIIVNRPTGRNVPLVAETKGFPSAVCYYQAIYLNSNGAL